MIIKMMIMMDDDDDDDDNYLDMLDRDDYALDH